MIGAPMTLTCTATARALTSNPCSQRPKPVRPVEILSGKKPLTTLLVMLWIKPKQQHARPYHSKLVISPFARLPSLSLICSKIFGTTLVIMHRALSQVNKLAAMNTMASAVTLTLLRCNFTIPTTTLPSLFLRTIIAKVVLLLLALAGSISY